MKRNITFSQIGKLKAERAQTLLKLTRLQETLRSEVDPEFDEGDPGLVEQERALALVLALEHLRQAQNGAYGVCEGCGEPIDPARLEAVPGTTLCLGCKVVDERRIRMRAIPVQI
jgi:RNA polymerase-binding transcription factor DksA